jgi:hypothetical protein
MQHVFQFPAGIAEDVAFGSENSRLRLLTRLPPDFATENQLRDWDSRKKSLCPTNRKRQTGMGVKRSEKERQGVIWSDKERQFALGKSSVHTHTIGARLPWKSP